MRAIARRMGVRRFVVRLVIAAAGLVALPPPAAALEYHFAGTVIDVLGVSQSYLGQRWSSTVTLDGARVVETNAAAWPCPVGRITLCTVHPEVFDRVTFTLGGETTELAGRNSIQVEDRGGFSTLSMNFDEVVMQSPSVLEPGIAGFGFSFRDDTGELMPDQRIPTQLDVSSVDLSRISAAVLVGSSRFSEDLVGGLLFEVDTFSFVPEPRTALLLGFGLALLSRRRSTR